MIRINTKRAKTYRKKLMFKGANYFNLYRYILNGQYFYFKIKSTRWLPDGVNALAAEFPLEGVQLLHEVEVGCNVGLASPHKIECVIERHVQLGHEVGDRDSDGARHSCQAVNQHSLLLTPSLLCLNQYHIIICFTCIDKILSKKYHS